MNNKNRYYKFALVLLIVGAILKLFQVPHATSVVISGFITCSAMQMWYIRQLEKQVSREFAHAHNTNLLYVLSAILIIAGATLTMLHIPYAMAIFISSSAGGLWVQNRHITKLENEIKRTEQVQEKQN